MSAAAQDFAYAIIMAVFDVTKSEAADADATMAARRQELEAAIRQEHGAEAETIIEEGYQIAREIRDIAKRYWAGELA